MPIQEGKAASLYTGALRHRRRPTTLRAIRYRAVPRRWAFWSFLRTGSVTTFDNGDGSIDSQAEFDTVIGLPARVKVVSQSNYCSGVPPDIVGCRPFPGN